MPIRAILFDKDGTLLDYEKTWGTINRAAADLAAMGDPVLAQRLLTLGGIDSESGRTRADSLLAAGNTREIAEAWVGAGSGYSVERLTEDLDTLFTTSASHAVPVTNLSTLFERLTARGIILGIASSDSEVAIRTMLRHFGIERFVSCVIGYDSGYGSKPDPGMLLGFSKAVGVPSSEIAMIGDNLHDMAMGKAGGAGLRIGVLTGTGTRETLSNVAHFCLPSIANIEEKLFESKKGNRTGAVRNRTLEPFPFGWKHPNDKKVH